MTKIKPELILPARTALQQCCAVKPGEKVLVLSNAEQSVLAEALFEMAKELKCDASLVYFPAGKVDGEEPPANLFEPMNAADVVVAVTQVSISHTKMRSRVSENGRTRIASIPGVTEESFIRGMSADYSQIKKVSERVMKVLDAGQNLHISTPSGTDLKVNIGNPALVGDGDISVPGTWSNLPDGESELAPVSADGIMVADTCEQIITEPTRLVIKDGYIVDIQQNASGRRFEKMLQECELRDGNNNSRFIAEFAIGTNPTAKVCGNWLEDEKVLGTAHIAFGNNTSYPGGKNYASFHVDLIMLRPTIVIDGKIIQKDGDLLI